MIQLAQNSLEELIKKLLGTPSGYTESSMAALRDKDDIRGKVYDTAPYLSSIIGLANSEEVKFQLENLSNHSSNSFSCVNVNVRLDFGHARLQKIHNLGVHQDFHYVNTFVTPKNSFVLWAPIKILSPKVGGIGFVKDLANIDGAINHEAHHRGKNQAPHWIAHTDQTELDIEHLRLHTGEFLLFDMRHLHTSVPNKDPIFPRITLQARFSSFHEPGFKEYYKYLPKVKSSEELK